MIYISQASGRSKILSVATPYNQSSNSKTRGFKEKSIRLDIHIRNHESIPTFIYAKTHQSM
jgi:hypothetical protein